MRRRDVGLDTLFDLDGEVMVVHEDGYWVKFEVKRVEQTLAKPHGLDYSLTLHAPDNQRILGFDNAHPVPPTRRGQPQDHEHRKRSTRPYEYQSAADLLEAFWVAVDRELRERGCIE